MGRNTIFVDDDSNNDTLCDFPSFLSPEVVAHHKD